MGPPSYVPKKHNVAEIVKGSSHYTPAHRVYNEHSKRWVERLSKPAIAPHIGGRPVNISFNMGYRQEKRVNPVQLWVRTAFVRIVC